MTMDTLLNLIKVCGAEPHTVLGAADGWHSDELDNTLANRAHAELAQLGLSGSNGVDPDLLTVVETITYPYVEYYAWIAGAYEGAPVNYTVLACAGTRDASVLVRNIDNDTVVLLSVPRDRLLHEFIAQLPALEPGNGQAVTASHSDVFGTGPGEDETFTVMRGPRQSKSALAASEVKRILNLQRLGGGQLYTAHRNRAGMRRRVERPLVYIDTPEGRWLTEETAGTGEPDVACTPATPQLLAHRLHTNHSALVD